MVPRAQVDWVDTRDLRSLKCVIYGPRAHTLPGYNDEDEQCGRSFVTYGDVILRPFGATAEPTGLGLLCEPATVVPTRDAASLTPSALN